MDQALRPGLAENGGVFTYGVAEIYIVALMERRIAEILREALVSEACVVLSSLLVTTAPSETILSDPIRSDGYIVPGPRARAEPVAAWHSLRRWPTTRDSCNRWWMSETLRGSRRCGRSLVL